MTDADVARTRRELAVEVGAARHALRTQRPGDAAAHLQRSKFLHNRLEVELGEVVRTAEADGAGRQDDPGGGPYDGAMEHEANRAYARRNEELLRGANAALERDADERGVPDSRRSSLLCECAEACGGMVSVTFDEWEAVHRHDDRFIVAPGHEAPAVERVLARCERYVTVEKYPLVVPPTS
jgi:hypothetical protein